MSNPLIQSNLPFTDPALGDHPLFPTEFPCTDRFVHKITCVERPPGERDQRPSKFARSSSNHLIFTTATGRNLEDSTLKSRANDRARRSRPVTCLTHLRCSPTLSGSSARGLDIVIVDGRTTTTKKEKGRSKRLSRFRFKLQKEKYL